MAFIKHRVGIVAPPERVWQAITDADQLSGWWASSAQWDSGTDESVSLDFEGLTTLVFNVVQREEERLLRLQNDGGLGPWNGSILEFSLHPDEGQTFVILTHENQEASDEDFQFFTTKWPIFLVSLKGYLETGEGRPFPNDIKIEKDL